MMALNVITPKWFGNIRTTGILAPPAALDAINTDAIAINVGAEIAG